MTTSTGYSNRRRFPRFKVDTGLFIIHSDFGKVQEVGIGGAVFTYIEKDFDRRNYPTKGVIFSQTDDYLVELPFKTVSDSSVPNSSLSRYNLRKRTVVFDELSTEQLNQLEDLILNNVVIPIQEECLVTMMADVSRYQGGRSRQGERTFVEAKRYDQEGGRLSG